MSKEDMFGVIKHQKAARKYWQQRFGSLTLAERQALIRSTSEYSEFEVQARIYSGLLAMGWHVKGELASRCGSARFDIVVFDRSFRPVRVIEVKKRKKDKGGSAQSSRYAEFGIPVTCIRGMADAERFLAACSPELLPHPTHTVSANLLTTAGSLPTVGPKVKLTPEMIEAGRCKKAGGFKHRQLTLLGVKVPTSPGWEDRLVGVEMDELVYLKFMQLSRANGKGKFM